MKVPVCATLLEKGISIDRGECTVDILLVNRTTSTPYLTVVQCSHDEYIAHSVLDEAQAMIIEYKMHESALVVTGTPDVKAAAQHRQIQFATREATFRGSVQDLRARIERFVSEGSSLLSSEEFPSWDTGRGSEVVLLGEDGASSAPGDLMLPRRHIDTLRRA